MCSIDKSLPELSKVPGKMSWNCHNRLWVETKNVLSHSGSNGTHIPSCIKIGLCI